MPELPEVETVARQLAPLIRGRLVKRLEILDPKLEALDGANIRGRVVGKVRRLGKQVVIELLEPAGKRGTLWLAVHLRMTGRLVYLADASAPPPSRPRARVILDKGELLFIDARRFGTLRLTDVIGDLHPAGLDPMGDDFTPAALAGLLAGARQAIKPWLLRQDRLSGVGNIYASEILFAARLNPFRAAGSLGKAETRRLREAVLKILTLGIEHGGTTFSDFQNAHGESGRFQKMLAVYGRAGEPCKHCGAPIERTVQQGRSTFFCQRCQKAEEREPGKK